MNAFETALIEFRRQVESPTDLASLRAVASQLVEACEDTGDLLGVVEGISALLGFYEEPFDAEVLAAQLNSELEAIAFLRAMEAPAVAEVLFDEVALAEFLDEHRSKLTDLQAIGETEEGDLGTVGRLLHSLKGDAGTVGATQLESAYHRLEDRLARCTEVCEICPSLLAVVDWAYNAAQSFVEGDDLAQEQPVWPPFAEAKPEAVEAYTAPDEETLALFADFYAESFEGLAAADDLLVQNEHSEPDPEDIAALFRIFHTIKGTSGFLDFHLIGRLAHATEARLDRSRRDVSQFDAPTVDLLLRSTEQMKALMDARRVGFEQAVPFRPPAGLDVLIEALGSEGGMPAEAIAALAAMSPADSDEEAPSQSASSNTRQPSRLEVVKETIKVDLARVDKLVETIGELVIMEAMVTQSYSQQNLSSQQARYQMSQLSKVVRDLQRQGLALRMVPLRGVFGKMSRLVRDLSRRSNKEVKLILQGQDAEMDRSLAERLGDPLIHMVRNGIDHGIESPEERVAAGKPRAGTLRLSAYHEGGSIVIELADDGKGLDRKRILEKAVERGLVTDPDALTDREVWDLIFDPGFSTAAAVTEISGRGVGMDVVKRTIEELRGRITIVSVPGKGTTFRFLLPLTLAIIDGMLVACGSERYVLPTLTIEESIRPTADQLHQFGGAGSILDVRGERLPLVNLAGVLNVPSPTREDPLNGLVMMVDGVNGRFGLVVDDVIGQQQVVIKHLSESINDQSLFSGAAILSDGQVGLILNTTRLGPSTSYNRGISHAC